MTVSKRPQGVLFIARWGFDLFLQETGQMLRFPFTQNAVRDMDVIGTDVLQAQIKSFIQQNKIQPQSLLIVLSDTVVFGKVLTAVDPAVKERERQAFLETIPHQVVGSTEVPGPKGTIIIGVNRELYSQIQKCFEENGFYLDTVIPAIVFQDSTLATGLTAASAIQILAKMDTMKQYNLASVKPQQPVSAKGVQEDAQVQQVSTAPEKKNASRTVILVVVFVFLLIVLAVVYFMSNSSTPATP